MEVELPAKAVETLPDVSHAAPAPADAGSARCEVPTTTAQHARQDARSDRSAIPNGSAFILGSQEEFDSSPAGAESFLHGKVVAPEGTTEPAAEDQVSKPSSDPPLQQGAKESEERCSAIDFISAANHNPARQAQPPTANRINLVSRGDSLKKVPASTSTPEQITKSALKPASDSVHSQKLTEANEVVSVLPQLSLREASGFMSPAGRPINPAHTSRDSVDLFAALESDRVAPAPTWVYAGTHHAEAGYLDPALGWIGVRADASGKGLHASLVPPSAEAAQVLGSHLAGLNSYLSEHQGGVVTMDAPQDGQVGTGAHPGNHQPSHQEQAPGREEPAPSALLIPAQALVGASPCHSALAVAGEARYISVVA